MMVLDKYRTIPREGLFLKREEAAYIAGFLMVTVALEFSYNQGKDVDLVFASAQ